MTAGECGIGIDQVGDLSIERVNMAIDLIEALPALALEEGDRGVLLAVFERRTVSHQAVAGIDESAIWACCGLRAGLTGGCLIGDQRLMTLGSVGELAFDASGVGMAIEARFGDVDADRLW